MSIWNLKVRDSEPTLEVSFAKEDALEKAELDSVRPFEAECIGSIVTSRGQAHNFNKPNGRFRCVDEHAAEKLAQRIRTRKAEHFKLMVEAEDAFNEIFSKDPWPEPVPVSETRAIIKTLSKFAKTLVGVGS